MPNRDGIAAYLNNTRRRKWRRASGNARGLGRFGMLAGDNGGGYRGFALASVLGSDIGSISGQPFGFDNLLAGCVQETSSGDLTFVIEGDILTDVAGKDIWIEGIPYTPTLAWAFLGGFTQCVVDAVPLIFRDTTYYRIEVQ